MVDTEEIKNLRGKIHLKHFFLFLKRETTFVSLFIFLQTEPLLRRGPF